MEGISSTLLKREIIMEKHIPSKCPNCNKKPVIVSWIPPEEAGVSRLYKYEYPCCGIALDEGTPYVDEMLALWNEAAEDW